MDVIKKIFSSILNALYQQFWFSFLAAILFMFLFLYANEHGWKGAFRSWYKMFKESSQFKKLFCFIFYLMMILMRTLLNRSMWLNPLSDVMGKWRIYEIDGTWTTEPIENIILTIPFATLFLCTFKNEILGKVKFCNTIWSGFKYTFFLSIIIELLQLFLRLGTFQLSDIFYNTLGGFIGGMIYYIIYNVWSKFKQWHGDKE